MALPIYHHEEFLDFTDQENVKRLNNAFEKIEREFGSYKSMIIDGRNIDRDKTFKSANPNNPSQIIGEYPIGTKKDVDQAVNAAEKAFKNWRSVPVVDRISINLRIARLLQKYRYELNALMVLEVGKSWCEADAEVAEGIDQFEYIAREMISYDQGKELTPFEGELNEYRYIPLGVGAVITPWNYPIGITTGMISASIVSGNTVVFKPSSDSPAISHFLLKIFKEAGLPSGVVNLIYGSGSLIGDYLAQHPKIKFIGFTGSKEVGIKVAQHAVSFVNGQQWFKRTILELGGKNGVIVDSETDIEEAVDGIIAGAFGYQGQKCSACSRAIVVKDIYDDFVQKLKKKIIKISIGPVKDGNTVGAVINKAAEDKVLSYIEIGKGEGDLIAGGNKVNLDGYIIEPTVFTNVSPQARIAQEEVFGPVLAVIKANDFDDALSIANDTIYGLSGGVYTNNPKKLAKAKEEFYVGNLYLNRKNTGAWIGSHPFGGFNMSGTNSKLGGPDYLLEYLQPKLITQRIGL